MERLPFEAYESVAREVAERLGNTHLVRAILMGYVNVAQTYTYYPVSEEERQKVAETHIKLIKVAMETQKSSREADSRLQNLLELSAAQEQGGNK